MLQVHTKRADHFSEEVPVRGTRCPCELRQGRNAKGRDGLHGDGLNEGHHLHVGCQTPTQCRSGQGTVGRAGGEAASFGREAR